MTAIGIDLGTANARVAIATDAGSELVVVDGSSTELAAVVSVEGDSIMVGQMAARRAVTHPTTTVRCIKTLLGKAADDYAVKALNPQWNSTDGGAPDTFAVDFGGRAFTAVQLVAMLFNRLVENAQEQTGAAPDQAVVALPQWFTGSQREALQAAVDASNLPAATQLQPESLAAASGLGLTTGPRRTVAIVDIGAASTTVAIIAVGGDAASDVLGTECDRSGGDAADLAALRGIFARLGIPDPDAATWELVRQASEAMKIDLSTMAQSEYRLPYVPNPSMSPELTLKRSELEQSLNQSLMISLRSRCAGACRVAGIEIGQLEEVHVVGGMSHVPAVVQSVGQIFGKPPRRSTVAKGAVALGAARLAAATVQPEAAPPAEPEPAPPQEAQPERRAMTPPPPPAPPATPEPDAEAADADPASRPAEIPPPPPTMPPQAASQPPPKISHTAIPHEVPPEAPPSRASIAPGRPSVAAAAPDQVTSGKIANPKTVAELHTMPLTQPLSAEHLKAISLPVLLLRIMGRPTVSGTLTIDMAGMVPIKVPFIKGRAVLPETERALLIKSFSEIDGSYSLDKTPPERPPGFKVSMLNLVTELLRSWMRNVRPEELRDGLKSRIHLGPVMSEKRREAVLKLGLTATETRFVGVSFDGVRSAGDLADHSGAGPRTTLTLLTIFELFRLLEWQEVTEPLRKPLDQVLRERAADVDKVNHFEALSVHWAAATADVEEAYAEMRRLTSPGGRWHNTAPEACPTIWKRAEEAYAVLRDENRRTAYRAKTYRGKNYEAITDFLAQKARAAAMHDDQSDYHTTTASLREVKRTSTMLPSQRKKRIKFSDD